MNATTYLLIAAGGAVGSVGRAWVGTQVARMLGMGFPWGTMIINVVGSAIIGIVAATALASSRSVGGPEVRIFLMVGFCGGFTTFSSFSLQTFELLREGRMAAAFANIVLSVGICLIASAAGYLGTASLLSR
ncbi:fluoride efflux transporter CrcB [Acidisoma cellulosilytica]|uniref:Fluoride-specific ion channel FluC n=1 Tax=Acidisoma cellulosilyticum TaxID=2802395 RepID=A0A963YZ90_9PROT|nr:fluoride efflux transporter CrcB [Acidisoma cellulosilyticum]MCB8878918.1 fluoride efflux transporter CrcB [Acidisoma cellulosilyticum]